MTDNHQLLAELARVKVLFQARALAAAMGLPQLTPTPPRSLPMQDDLIALAERCEAARNPVDVVHLNGAILRALGWNSDAINVYDPAGERRSGIPSYTLSMEDAATLIPAGWWWSTSNCSISADASCGPDVAHCGKELLVRFDDGIHVELDQPSTPALALCAAAIRARAAMGGGDD